LIIGFQDTVENVGDVFLGHSVIRGAVKKIERRYVRLIFLHCIYMSIE